MSPLFPPVHLIYCLHWAIIAEIHSKHLLQNCSIRYSWIWEMNNHRQETWGFIKMKVRQECCFIFFRNCTQNALWLLLTALSLIAGLGWEHTWTGEWKVLLEWKVSWGKTSYSHTVLCQFSWNTYGSEQQKT